MSRQTTAQLANGNDVRQSLAQICASCEEFDSFFSGVFDRLENLAAELVSREHVWASQREAAVLPEKSPAGEQLAAEVGRLKKERDQLEQQQQLLAAELDTVRNRAAEMAERLAQQETQLAAERTQWSEELKRMRHVIEALTRQQAEQLAQMAGREVAVEPSSPPSSFSQESPPPAADSVLGSVMAQFELLQRDVTKRRTKVAATI